MAILWNQEQKVFYLHTQKTSYVMGILDDALLCHMYWGKRIRNASAAESFCPSPEGVMSSNEAWLHGDLSSETAAQEYGIDGGTDLRHPTIEIVQNGRTQIAQMKYKCHNIVKGKAALKGLPYVYTESDDEADTLEITMEDEISGMQVILTYNVFESKDAITRNTRIRNNTKNDVTVKRALSACVDFEDDDYELIHLPGAWARERHVERQPLMTGDYVLSSARGASSHMENPFFALARKNTTENSGECYGFNLVYSGGFEAGVQKTHLGGCRAYIGINPRRFEWKLGAGEEFQAPEAVLTYSDQGLGGMSRIFHTLYRERLCRGKYRDAERPVLINNWEATYFDFNEEKILNIANNAKKIGIDLMVLDDGWFGHRNDADSSLGDWFVNKEKLPNGISGLAEKVEAIGMKFGIWMEPEMISEDSELHKAHPDWHIHVPGYTASCGRNQWILDLSRTEVQDYVIGAVKEVLGNSKISYMKWDMNRNMAEIGSAELPAEQTGELCHRYILGLYRILEEVTGAFPDVLFESCSGGGGRFDPGMLYYMPQTWASDCTDGLERVYIQYGTSMAYPTTAMGAHVSASPNHQIGRLTSIKFRSEVAMMGQYGFELDLSVATEEEIAEMKKYLNQYKELRHITHYGDMYRLLSPFGSDTSSTLFVTKEKDKAVMCIYCLHGKPDAKQFKIRLDGLDADADYVDKETGVVYGGDVLMQSGVLFRPLKDCSSKVIVFEKVTR